MNKVVFSENLRRLMKEEGVTQMDLATATGLSQSAVSSYFTKGATPSGEILHLIANYFGVTMEHILTGTSPPTATRSPAPSQAPRHGGGPYFGTSGLVPIISWARAGQGHYYEDQGYDVPHIPTGCKDPNCYALTIVGDSMEPLYWDGDIVVVIPRGEPVNNGLVIVKTKEDEVLFKVYQTCKDPKLVLLTSINTKHPPIWMHLKEIRFIHIVHSIVRTFQKKFGFTVHREHETEGA